MLIHARRKVWWGAVVPLLLFIVLAVSTCDFCIADDSAAASQRTFEQEILPILRKHCLDCHTGETAEAGLQLDSPLTALRGGDSGEPTIVPGKSEQSELISRLHTDDAKRRMPLDAEPLAADEIKLLSDWIRQRNNWVAAEKQLAEEAIDLWSFQPCTRPALPEGSEGHPIDAFIDHQLKPLQLERSPLAERRKLIRRLYLIMLGLPPTPEQVQQFVDDSRPDAWEHLIDTVLSSPHYGERWGAHWLDLVRFGETHGFETNRERPHAWTYRDYVIQSFNDDKPYDQFVREQIAGDALGADVATGFLVAGPYDLVKGQDPQLRLMQRQDELADIINTTGTAFLGLTLGCARCHNHKFDPITQTDFYALQAVFSGVNHADRELPLSPEQVETLAKLDAEIKQLEGALAKYVVRAEKRESVNPLHNEERFAPQGVKMVRFTILATNQSQPCLDELEIFSGDRNIALAAAGAVAKSSGDFVHPLHKLEHIHDGKYGNSHSWIASEVAGGWVQIEFPQVNVIDRIVWARDRQGKYQDRLAVTYQIEGSTDGDVWVSLASSEDRLPYAAGTKSEVKVTYDFSRLAEAEADGARLQVQQLEELRKQRDITSQRQKAYAGTFSQPGPTHRLYRGEPNAPREQVAPAAIRSLTDWNLSVESPEQQRRLQLANWIAAPENPLTARVIVNRIWQFHFGHGIVDTPSDFGANGVPPTHPELLDWLASELMDKGWSLKSLHRLILTSATWQQSSQPHAAGMQVDAQARYLWRFPVRRLEAEAIRDSLLAVTGHLNTEKGGPGFSAFKVELENVRHYFPKEEFGPEDWRRMIYMTKVRQERDAVFGAFDCPDCSQVVPVRSRSTTPLQALNLLNSRFVMQQSELFAERLRQASSLPAEQIELAYQLCFGRSADAEEVQLAQEFIAETDLIQFSRAMLNSNEFVFIP